MCSSDLLSGLTPEKAAIGRFGYAEKMEYWAVIWGTIIMGATGLMIWFKMDITLFVCIIEPKFRLNEVDESFDSSKSRSLV